MRIHVPVPLRWSDLNAGGHIDNAIFLTLLEQTRISAFWATGEGEKPDHAAVDARPGTSTHTLIARQLVEYLAPLHYSEAPLDVALWIGRMGGSDLDVYYEVRTPGGATLVARAMSKIVLVDASTHRPRRISPEQRAAWAPYVEQPIGFRP